MSIEKTFWMRSPRDFLVKLDWDIKQLAQIEKFDVLPYSFQTINCGVAAWSMVDWVFQHLNDHQKIALGTASKGQLKKLVQRESSALSVCREIADASKHLRLDNAPSPVIGTPYIAVWEKIDGSHLATMPIVNSDEMIDSLVLMRAARTYWDLFLRSHDM